MDVNAVLTCLHEFGLVINPGKSLFCRDSVEFLGITVTSTSISTLEKQTAVIAKFAVPTTKKDL